MIKLVKYEGDRLLYWEVWQDNDILVIHSGEVGTRGIVVEEPLKKRANAQKMMDDFAKEKIATGYIALDTDDLPELIIQYKADGFGSIKNVEQRHQLESILDQELGWTGNGHCEGGDTSRDEMSIYCRVVHIEKGLKTVLAVLQTEPEIPPATITSIKDDEQEIIWSSASTSN